MQSLYRTEPGSSTYGCFVGDYEWSSYNQRIGAEPQWLDADQCFESLGHTEVDARTNYRSFVESGIPDGEYELIQEAVQRNQLTGSGRFVDAIEATLGLRVERRGQGRPRIKK